MQKYMDAIRKASIFSGIRKDELFLMLETLDSQLKNYREGQIVLKSGKRVPRAGLILEGSVEIYREGFWGTNYGIGEVRQGELFAVAFAASSGSISNVSCKATHNTVILWFNIQDIFNLDDHAEYHTVLIRNLMAAMASQTLTVSSNMMHMKRKTTRQKLLSFLSEQSWIQGSSEFDIPYNRQGLADYLSVERSAMSAELSKLAHEGYFIYRRNHFTLLKVAEEVPEN